MKKTPIIVTAILMALTANVWVNRTGFVGDFFI